MSARVASIALALWLCASFACAGELYGPPAPPLAPDGYARAAVDGFILWRPSRASAGELVVADDEPSPKDFTAPDLLQIARARKMTILFLGRGREISRAEAVIAAQRQAKLIGVGSGEGADFLADLARERSSFDALLLAGAAPQNFAKGGPFVIELYGSDAFWRMPTRPPASALKDAKRRRFFLAGAVVSPSAAQNCAAPVNARSIAPALRALLVALLDHLAGGPPPPPSREADLAQKKDIVLPKIPGAAPPPPGEGPAPKVDADGNEASGLRLPDQALPLATFTAWNAVKDKAKGECAAGARYDFPPSRAAREAAKDPRQSLIERYGSRSYFVAALRSVADRLVKERLLLPQDADAYVAAGKEAPF